MKRRLGAAFRAFASKPETVKFATIPPINRAWADDEASRDERREIALCALSETTVAIFSIAVVTIGDEGPNRFQYDVRLLSDVPIEVWPVLTETMTRIAKETRV